MSREHAFRKLSDRDEVARPYRDSANFDARVRLYERFGTNPPSLLAWLFEKIALAPRSRVLRPGGRLHALTNAWTRRIERLGSFHVGATAGLLTAVNRSVG